MGTPIGLKVPIGALVLIYSDGTLLFVEPVSEVFEPHKFGAKAN
jgi:hypothetical protein